MPDNRPFVSIITITYNRANLIHRAIESIQRQTYRNYEHIIVDGASTDDTAEVVNSYGDEKIKYIRLNERGPTLQMFEGFKASSGKYIAFLDDDDEYLYSKIEKQVALFESLPDDYGLVYCWMSYYDNNNPEVVLRTHNPALRGYVGDLAVERPIIAGTPTLMFRRTVFAEFGGAWKDGIGLLGSDWEFATRVCQKYQVDYVPESLVKVYVNHGSNRLSAGFYQDQQERQIIFHLYFLETFASVFAKYPEKKNYHAKILAFSFMMLGRWKEAWPYYKIQLRQQLSLKTLLLPFYCIFKRLSR